MFEGAWEGKVLFQCLPCARFLSIFFELFGTREADVSHFLGPAQGAETRATPGKTVPSHIEEEHRPLAGWKVTEPTTLARSSFNHHRIRAGKGPFKASSTSPQTRSCINPAECRLSLARILLVTGRSPSYPRIPLE